MIAISPFLVPKKILLSGVGILFLIAPLFVSAQQIPAITLFSHKDPDPTTGATLIVWQSSGTVNASIDFTCPISPPSASVKFTTDKGNNPICEKGSLWLWDNQDDGSITVFPLGNARAVTVPFTLSLFNTQNGAPVGEKQTINITFPAPVSSPSITSPSIALFTAKDPNTAGAIPISWRASGVVDTAQIDFTCPSSANIQFATDKGNNPTCEKGALWLWNNQTEGSIIVYPAGNTQPVSIPFTLTLIQNGVDTRQKQQIDVVFPVVGPQAPMLTLTAIPSQVVAGNSAIVNWTSTHATSCIGDWVPGGIYVTATNGLGTGSIYKDTTYSISCSGPGGSVTRSITVKVVRPSSATNSSATITVSPSPYTSAQSGESSGQQGDTGTSERSSCVDLQNNMRYGATDAQTGGEISALQGFLNGKGYLASAPTGYFGRMTVAAVQKLQAEYVLVTSGYVGPMTREKIKTETCTVSSVQTTPAQASSNRKKDINLASALMGLWAFLDGLKARAQ